jgi:hypothetical protein
MIFCNKALSIMKKDGKSKKKLIFSFFSFIKIIDLILIFIRI